MKVSYEHRIEAPLARVIEAYSSADFYVEKQKSSGATEVEVLTHEETGGGRLTLRARVTEPSRQPAFIRKSDHDTFIDESVLDREAGTLTWKITPAEGADKFFLSGVVEFHDQGEATRVVYNISLEVKIPFVGAKVEKFALGKTEEETAAQAAFLSSWLS